MGWVNDPPATPKKPSRVLGFLLAVVLLAALLLLVLELAGRWRLLGLTHPPIGLERGQWVLLLGVVAAIAGWVVSAIVTMRNSIRQHTVTTLLSSRLSETYMTQTRLVNARYFSPAGAIYKLTADEVTQAHPDAQLGALRYLLNYFEFIAVGIRYGDLDEKLLKNTLRGILCSIYEAAGPLVAQTRQAPDNAKDRKSRTFEHLEWLYARWHVPELQRKVAVRPVSHPVPAAAPARAPAVSEDAGTTAGAGPAAAGAHGMPPAGP